MHFSCSSCLLFIDIRAFDLLLLGEHEEEEVDDIIVDELGQVLITPRPNPVAELVFGSAREDNGLGWKSLVA